MHRHTCEWNVPCPSDYEISSFDQLVHLRPSQLPVAQHDRMTYLKGVFRILRQQVERRQDPFTPRETRAMRAIRSDADKMRCASLPWGDREEITEFARQWTLCRYFFIVQCHAHVLLDLHGDDDDDDRFAARWKRWDTRYRDWWIDHELLLTDAPLADYSADDAWNTLQRLAFRWNDFMEPLPQIEALVRALEMHVAREVVLGEADYDLKRIFKAECILRYMSGMFLRFRYLPRDTAWIDAEHRRDAFDAFCVWFAERIAVLHSKEFRLAFRDRMVDWMVPLGSMEWARLDENVRKAKGFYLLTHLAGISRTNALRQHLVAARFDDERGLLAQMFFLTGFTMMLDSRNIPFEKNILLLERDRDPGLFFDEELQQDMLRSRVPLLVQNFNGVDVYYEGRYINTREVRLALYVWLWLVHHHLYDHVYGVNIGDITRRLWP